MKSVVQELVAFPLTSGLLFELVHYLYYSKRCHNFTWKRQNAVQCAILHFLKCSCFRIDPWLGVSFDRDLVSPISN